MAAFEFLGPSFKSVPVRVFASVVAAIFCGVSVPVMLACQFIRERKHVSLILLIRTIYTLGCPETD